MLKNAKLRTKLLLSIVLVSAVILTATIGTITFKARKMALIDSRERAEEMAWRYASVVSTRLKTAVEAAQGLANSFEGIRNSATVNRRMMNGILRGVLQKNSDFLAVWSCWEPDMLDGVDDLYAKSEGHDITGRFVPLLFRDGDIIKEMPLSGYDRPGKGDFYLKAKNSERALLLDPYIHDVGDTRIRVTGVTVPIIHNDEVVGAVGVLLDLDSFRAIIRQIRPYGSGFASLIAADGRIAVDGNPDFDGKDLKELGEGKALESISLGKSFEDRVGDLYRIFVPIPTTSMENPWGLMIQIPAMAVLTGTRRILWFAVIVGMVGLAVLAIMALIISANIARPIVALTNLLDRLASLDLTQRKSEDWIFRISGEVGQMAHALGRLQIKITEVVSTLRRTAHDTTEMAGSLASLSQEQNASMTEIRNSVDQTAKATHDNASALEESNASIEEIASGAQAAAQSASEGAAAADHTLKTSQKAMKEVNEVLENVSKAGKGARDNLDAIKDLTESVNAISGFVSTITGISDQTNMLALNAAIEAARAGNAGRGFAVVAEEVRRLAEESASSASEIGGLIEKLREDSERSIRTAEGTDTILSEAAGRAQKADKQLQEILSEIEKIDNGSQNIASVSEEQAASSEEMSRAIQNITEGTMDIMEMVKIISSATDGTSQASDMVAGKAQVLAQTASTMESIFSQFSIDERTEGPWPVSAGQTSLQKELATGTAAD